MAYDEILAIRVESTLERIKPPKLVTKKMFGGIGFLAQGNMACGVIGSDLIVRVGKEAYEEAISHPETKQFDITGRAMTGWVMVSDQFLGDEADLSAWVQQGVDFALTLPPK